MDEEAVLALNAGHEAETSALDLAALRVLACKAFHVGLEDQGRAAFLIALAEDADYENPNFRWFKARYPRFVYIDRVVVSAEARGRGLARSLYEELFAMALATGRRLVGCEVNLEPPNPGSDAFHERLGFREAGRARLASGKLVRYLFRELPPPERRAGEAG